MTLEAIYFISQIVASVAVLASLIYLALQTRQTAKNQQAQMHATRVQLVRADSSRMGDPAFAPIWRAGTAAEPDMDVESLVQFSVFTYGLLQSVQETYHGHLEGMINSRRWEPTKRALQQLLDAPGFRAAFQYHKPTLDGEFVAFVEKLIADKNAAPAPKPPLERWRPLFAAERNAAQAGAPSAESAS